MTTKHYSRPTSTYAGEAGLSNRTKYYTDSTSSPAQPISSVKVDGDVNYLIDAVNELYDTAVTGVVADGSITNAKLRSSTALSVIGRSANTSGSPADIVAAVDNTVLLRKSNTVQFSTIPSGSFDNGAVTTSAIADTNVTFAKIQNVATGVLVGRQSSGAGPVEALTVGAGITLSAGAIAGATASETAVGVVELSTDAEAQTGTDTARAVTPANLKASQVGQGQVWTNVTGSRAVATDYTNSTGRPIMVAVNYFVSGVGGSTLTATIGGVAVPVGITAPTASSATVATFMVPNGMVYRVAASGGTATLTSWYELR